MFNKVMLICASLALIKGICCENQSSGAQDFIKQLNLEEEQLKDNYKKTIQDFFTQVQQDANNMLEQEDEFSAYALMRMSSALIEMENNKYALRLRTIEATKQILIKYFGRELLPNFVVDEQFAHLIVDRISLRSRVDGQKFSFKPYQKMQELYEYNQKGKQGAHLHRLIVFAIFEFQSVFEYYEKWNSLIEEFCKVKNVNDQKNFVKQLDRIIDQAMGCPECQEHSEPDGFGSYPMIESEELNDLVDLYVDSLLLTKIKQINEQTKGHYLESVPTTGDDNQLNEHVDHLGLD